MESKNILVSVLMTSYNREKYIGYAIESVLNSTYQNWELIIVDDGSLDTTVSIARTYAKEDSRIKVYVNPKNLGDYPNRNKAASYANGKYLKYVDADDMIYPYGLEILVSMMEQFPDAGWGLCSLEQDVNQPFPFILSPREAYLYHYNGPGLFHKAPLSSIVHKKIFDSVGGFKPERMVGDYEMWHRLAQKYPVVLMPHGLVWYRKHGEQEVNSVRLFIKKYEDIKLSYLVNENCPLEKPVVSGILESSKRHLRKNIIKGLLRLNGHMTIDNFKRLRQYV